jgi:hypothetical protein
MSESESHEPKKAQRAILWPPAKARGYDWDARTTARIPNAEAYRDRE